MPVDHLGRASHGGTWRFPVALGVSAHPFGTPHNGLGRVSEAGTSIPVALCLDDAGGCQIQGATAEHFSRLDGQGIHSPWPNGGGGTCGQPRPEWEAELSPVGCSLYTSDAADALTLVDLGVLGSV